MDKLIAEAEKIPQRCSYRLVDFLKCYVDMLILLPTDDGYRIAPGQGWNPGEWEKERMYLMPYKEDLIEILGRLK